MITDANRYVINKERNENLYIKWVSEVICDYVKYEQRLTKHTKTEAIKILTNHSGVEKT